MTLPTGTISFSQVNSELNRNSSTQLSMSDNWFYAMGNRNPSNGRGGQAELNMNDCKGGYYHTEVSYSANPTLGTGGASWVPSGWTQITGSNVDDYHWGFNNVMPVEIAGGLNGPIYVSSNSFITFGGGTNSYAASASAPPYPKIHIAGGDRSVQRLAYKWYDPIGNLNVRHLRLRWEGHYHWNGGTVGSPTVVWEATIFSRYGFNGVQIFEVRIGNFNGNYTGQTGVASASSWYATTYPAQNRSYVYYGTSSGTSWTAYTYRHRTGYPT